MITLLDKQAIIHLYRSRGCGKRAIIHELEWKTSPRKGLKPNMYAGTAYAHQQKRRGCTSLKSTAPSGANRRFFYAITVSDSDSILCHRPDKVHKSCCRSNFQ